MGRTNFNDVSDDFIHEAIRRGRNVGDNDWQIASTIREEIRKRRPKDGYMVAYATGVATRNQALREYDKALGLEDK